MRSLVQKFAVQPCARTNIEIYQMFRFHIPAINLAFRVIRH